MPSAVLCNHAVTAVLSTSRVAFGTTWKLDSCLRVGKLLESFSTVWDLHARRVFLSGEPGMVQLQRLVE